MDRNKMVFSQKLENDTKEIRIENLDVEFEEFHRRPVDIKEELLIRNIEQMEDIDVKLAELHHSVDIKDETLFNEEMEDATSVEQDCDDELECGICSVVFTNLLEFNDHNVEIHSDVKPLPGEVCDNKNYQDREKNRQVKTFVCGVCGYRCQRRAYLRSHFLQTHTGEKPFKCKSCDFTSKYLNTLKQHIELTHNVKKLFTCTICDYDSFCEANLKFHHLRVHQDLQSFKCKVCKFASLDLKRLQKHIKITHAIRKWLVCTVCDYTTYERANLKLHLQTHSTKKSHDCKTCNFKCSDLSILKNHNIATHIGKKRFTCEMCGFKCSLKGQLKIHSKNLVGEIPFRCEKCGFEWKMLTK